MSNWGLLCESLGAQSGVIGGGLYPPGVEGFPGNNCPYCEQPGASVRAGCSFPHSLIKSPHGETRTHHESRLCGKGKL